MSNSSNIARYRPTFSIFDDDFFAPNDMLMDRLLSKAFPSISKELGVNFFESGAYPKIDIRETAAEFIVEAEVPGLAKDQVKVEVKDDTLIIRGEKRSDEKKEGQYHVREIKKSSFIRSFSLSPDVVDKSTVKAKFQDGLLEVRIGKVKPAPPPKPDVKVIDIE
jgi:HSP20 family protein